MKDDRSNDEIREERKKKRELRVWKFFNSLKEAIFPSDITCDVCGEELVADTRYNLCSECMSKLPMVGEHICLNCGVPLKDEADFCIRCENTESEFSYNRSPLVYEGVAKDMILSLKFANKKYLAKTLGAMMADEYLNRKMSAEIAVYVPMTEWEEKKRGFNQSELLAREVADRLKLPLLPALIKTKDTSAQKELSRKEREENLKGAFKCVFDEVKNRKILLIDDVFTTGATATACAHVLLKGGAREVFVLTCAVTQKKIPFEGLKHNVNSNKNIVCKDIENKNSDKDIENENCDQKDIS